MADGSLFPNIDLQSLLPQLMASGLLGGQGGQAAPQGLLPPAGPSQAPPPQQAAPAPPQAPQGGPQQGADPMAVAMGDPRVQQAMSVLMAPHKNNPVADTFFHGLSNDQARRNMAQQTVQQVVSNAALQRAWQAVSAMPAGPQRDAAIEAMATNAPEFGKAQAQNFSPVTTAPGAVTTMYGGGASVSAPKITASNGMLINEANPQQPVVGTYSAPEKLAVTERPGSFTPTIGGAPGAPQLPTGTEAQTTGAPPQMGVGDPRQFFKSVILPQEGGLNPHDMNGSPTNYGINQAANPGVDVHKLTPDTAADIFAKHYYGPSGAANLPAPLAALHADTSFINPSKAQQFLAQSGGDPAKYMALRQAWMASMVANNPKAAPYAKAWGNRNAALAQYAGIGGAPQAGPGQAPQPPQLGQPTPPGWQVGTPALTPGPLTPPQMEALGYGKGTVGNRQPDGTIQVTQTPQTVGNFSTDDQARVSDLLKAADQARQVAIMSHEFMTHNSQSATGLGYHPIEVPIPFAHGEIDLNPAEAFMGQADPHVQAMQSLTSRAAPMLRPPGSGRIMGQEYGNFLRAFPNIKNSGDGNNEINTQLQNEATTLNRQAQFMSSWLRTHGSLNGADAVWQVQNPHGVGSAPPPQKVRVLNYNPKTGGLE